MSDLRQRLEELTTSQRRRLADRINERTPDRLLAYVAGETIGEDELKDFLRQRLSSHQIPSVIVSVTSLPRLPNGKLDRSALKRPATPPRPATSDTANETEARLLEIWREVLGFEEISIHDDFFEVGGDSILSIQLVSRARSAGIRIDPADLVDHPTIAGLARVARVARVARSAEKEFGVEENPGAGPIPLTPIQSWFFGLGLARPEHWNQAITISLPGPVDDAEIERRIGSVVARHPSLRTGFRRDGDVWIPTGSDHEARITWTEAPVVDAESLARIAEPLHRDLRFDGSALVRFGVVRSDRGIHIVVVAHHLIIDHYSWQILFHELTADPAKLVQPPATPEQWARFSRRQTPDEIGFWTADPDFGPGILPRDLKTEGPLLEAHSATAQVEFAGETARQLFANAHDAFHTKIEDLLLTALAATLSEWTGRRAFRIGLEKHGRDVPGIDVSRTVGWFTSYFPARLWLPEGDFGEQIRTIKEQLRAIPGDGIGYGRLRYSDDAEVVAKLSADETAEEVLFNFLGQRSGNSGIVHVADGARAPENRRSHVLEINCWQTGDALLMNWTFNQRAHQRATVEKWSRRYCDILRDLVRHCASRDVGFTPSDFPDAEMDQDELNEFLDQL